MSLRALFLVFLMAAAFTAFSQEQDEGRITVYTSEYSDPRQNIQLYPNPAPEYLYVRLGSLEASKVGLSVHNIIGNELTPEVEIVDEHELRVRVKEMASGYYFVTVKESETKFRAIYKFLKL